MSEKVKNVAQKVKAKTKSLMHIDSTKDDLEDDDENNPGEPFVEKIENNAGFNPQSVLNPELEASSFQKIEDQIPKNVFDILHIARHPKEAFKVKTASQLATSEEPYLKDEDDEDLIEIKKKLTQAQDNDDRDEEVYLQDLIEKTKESRRQKKVAWMTSRYVHRAQAMGVSPDTFAMRSVFRWRDSNDVLQGREWSQWFEQAWLFVRSIFTGQDSDNATDVKSSPWDRDMLFKQIERILMASAPWQRWVMQIHQVHSWENSNRTSIWFTVWLSVWALDRVASFALCLTIYGVLRRKFGYAKKEKLEDAQIRAEDATKTAHTFGELISRHGTEDWIDPVMDSVMPIVQPYVQDLADWIEVVKNFWDYRDSRSSDSALILLSFLLVFITFTGTEFCVRLVTLGIILGFFLHYPLSKRYRRYPYILLPVHWILWDVPTHTEASFNYLREQAIAVRKENPDLDPQSNLFAADCIWNEVKGTAIVSLNGIRFTQKFPDEGLWKRSWIELDEMKKGEKRKGEVVETAYLKNNQYFLELKFKDGTKYELGDLKNMDQMFNVIQAFSGLSWQHLPL